MNFWLLGRIKINFFCFNEVLYFVLQGPTVISIVTRTFQSDMRNRHWDDNEGMLYWGFSELLSRLPNWISEDAVLLEIKSC